ncbi:YbdD/YjiX family protein [Methylosarcina fibrata]|uniref:YbdD/YjiX family protein n=1 Tax=Methylosarcina fibrata TaxID=105972 RepID=UPI00036FDDDF|nr:YbdD/YjiX family protein [Methylosarcina fibrata]
MVSAFKRIWQGLRRLSGDDAYERYLKHHAEHRCLSYGHEAGEPPLSKAEFFKQWQERKWNGINRCC